MRTTLSSSVRAAPLEFDSTLTDVPLDGSGLTTAVRLVTAVDPRSVFSMHDVEVKADTLEFSVHYSKHHARCEVLAMELGKRQLQLER